LQQQAPAAGPGAAPQAAASQWLAFDPDNPDGIQGCVNRARNNARRIRGTITSAMWKELNKLYWQLRDPEFTAHARESPHEFLQAVECGSYLFQGVCDATMTHDEGWQFIQLGKYLERADKTLRVLDIQYHLLQEMADPADRPLSDLHWAGVLRGCRAYEPYQKQYAGRVEPERVVAFLLLHPESPRSVRFSLEAAARALAAIEDSVGRHGDGRAERVLGRVTSELKFAELEDVLRNNLHAFLGGVLERCAQVSRAVQEQYSLQ
jgi:uncharacterized alpha-E superfamily protein